MQVTSERARPAPLDFLDGVARVHVDGAASDGAYGLVDMTAPRGDMPPLHVHHRDDEAFYVLSGRLTLFVGERRLELGEGASALAPRQVPHTYRVESEEASWLVVTSPAGFEACVREVAEGGVSDPAELAEIAARYGIEILGPPGILPTDV